MILFNGVTLAKQRELTLQKEVQNLRTQDITPHIAAILFSEDAGSVLYTDKKKASAKHVGIGYEVHTFSMLDPVEQVIDVIQQLNSSDKVTGIIIQKPWRKTWESVFQTTNHQPPITFNSWWNQLTSAIAEQKDVDGLHPNTIAAIQRNTWQQEKRVLPATCKAVLTILDQAFYQTEVPRQLSKIAIVGRSDLLGIPLYHQLLNLHFEHVKLLGKKELSEYVELGYGLTEFDVVVTSTGQKSLITGKMIKPGAIVIDVGEPQPDAEYESVSKVAGFLTPVPGGVGPMTIVSLLENAVELCSPSS